MDGDPAKGHVRARDIVRDLTLRLGRALRGFELDPWPKDYSDNDWRRWQKQSIKTIRKAQKR